MLRSLANVITVSGNFARPEFAPGPLAIRQGFFIFLYLHFQRLSLFHHLNNSLKQHWFWDLRAGVTPWRTVSPQVTENLIRTTQ
jgi:hypothetical protein